MRNRRLFAILLMLAVMITSRVGAALMEKSTALKRLTTNCRGHCDAFTPCIVQEDDNGLEGDIKHLCLEQAHAKENDTVIIPIGNIRDINEIDYAVDTIGEIELSPSAKYLTLAGSNAPAGLLQGNVTSVEFGPDFAICATQSVSISLVNLDLSSAVDRLSSILPVSTTELNLKSGLLAGFPTIPLLSVPSLSSLNLDFNSIVEIDESAYSRNLVSLSLQDNHMHTFRGYFPKLQSLSLANNRFTRVPESVFRLPKLTTLFMAGNGPLSREFTAAQANFLQGLAWDLMDEDFVSLGDCKSDMKLIHGVAVCIADDSTRLGFAISDDARSDELYTRKHAAVQRKLSTYSDYYCPGYYSAGVLIGSILGTMIFMCIIGGLAWKWQLRRQARQANKQTNPTQHNDDEYMADCSDPQLLALQLNADDIEDVRKIGGGGYADVWLVRYQGTRLLAAKRLRMEHESHQFTQSFVDEIKLVAKFDHPNIVKLVGVAWTIGSNLQALSEYMVGGDLREYLIYRHTPRTWTARKLQIATDVIDALVYVHSFAPPIIHRDLKSRNVLLSKEMQAKLTDFGVSRIMSENNTMTQGVGTSRWEAPEVLAGKDDYNQSADIFSFGVVLSELDMHTIPYDDAQGSNGNPLANVAILQMVAKGDLRPSFSPNCPPHIRALADRCLAHDPSKRPSAPEIAYALRSTTI